ncbi:MAG TPA: hypothetical protein VK603_06640, partial [Candidatus Saccharimonadales bacterium]|nr:hypothetical protein [Candidatus Saccharimonadales bacterium]
FNACGDSFKESSPAPLAISSPRKLPVATQPPRGFKDSRILWCIKGEPVVIWSDTAHSPSHGSAFPKRAKTKVVHVKPVELTKSEKHFISPLYKIRNHQIRYKIPKLDVAGSNPGRPLQLSSKSIAYHSARISIFRTKSPKRCHRKSN